MRDTTGKTHFHRGIALTTLESEDGTSLPSSRTLIYIGDPITQLNRKAIAFFADWPIRLEHQDATTRVLACRVPDLGGQMDDHFTRDVYRADGGDDFAGQVTSFPSRQHQVGRNGELKGVSVKYQVAYASAAL